jgi:hypothetical protein
MIIKYYILGINFIYILQFKPILGYFNTKYLF